MLTLARLWLTTQAISLLQPPPNPGQSSCCPRPSFLGSRCLPLTSSPCLRACQPWNPYWASHNTVHQCFKGGWSLAMWERQSRLPSPKPSPSPGTLWPGASEAWSVSIFWPPEDNPPSPSNVLRNGHPLKVMSSFWVFPKLRSDSPAPSLRHGDCGHVPPWSDLGAEADAQAVCSLCRVAPRWSFLLPAREGRGDMERGAGSLYPQNVWFGYYCFLLFKIMTASAWVWVQIRIETDKGKCG